MPATFAVVETGGKQYRVAPGDTIDVEYLAVEEGVEINLDRVLMVGGDEGVTLGTPIVEGASVRAAVITHDRAKKIVVFKYKNKTRYRRKTGHRQSYTRLHIQDITA